LLRYFTFGNVFLAVVAGAAVCALAVYISTHLKWDFAVDGYGWKEKLRTIHFNEAWMTFYDTELSARVNYARHAISIDRIPTMGPPPGSRTLPRSFSSR
jgi:hypothetical protein